MLVRGLTYVDEHTLYVICRNMKWISISNLYRGTKSLKLK